MTRTRNSEALAEPIVGTPEDAFRCFMSTDMETLVAGNCILRKDRQIATLAEGYQHTFALD